MATRDDRRTFTPPPLKPAMAHVVQPLDQPSNYKDSQARLDRSRQDEALSRSSTLYVCSSFICSYAMLTPG
jgi:hypothetical protein